jgi:AcrR family transcriptional regulator
MTSVKICVVAADPILEPNPRRRLSARQRATVDALLDATLEVLDEVGFEPLSIRTVAGRAGVTHTTAYTYFSSKEHLVAESFRRLLVAIPRPADVEDPTAPVADRVVDALEPAARVLTGRPALAQAALAAMSSADPDVAAVRDEVGAELVARFRSALPPSTDPAVIDTLMLTFSGAMLQAGMGYFDFDGVVARMSAAAGHLGLDRQESP